MIAIGISLLSGIGLIALGLMDVSMVLLKERNGVSSFIFSLSTETSYHVGLVVAGIAFLVIPVLYLWERRNWRRWRRF